MFNISNAPSRFSQRINGARARRRAMNADRAFSTPNRTSLGQTLAVGLGCDRI